MTQGVITEDHVLLAPPFDGVRLEAGDPKYIDVNEDGTADVNDKVVIGNPNPDFIFAFNTALKYKAWTFKARLDGSVGNDVLNLNRVVLADVSKVNNVYADSFEKAYRNGSGELPAVGAQLLDQISDRMVENGSFVRLSNLSIGYDIPLNEPFKKYLHGLTVSIMADNLFVITKYSGFDPDVNSFGGDWSRRGIDLGAYPRARTFSLGFVAKF